MCVVCVMCEYVRGVGLCVCLVRVGAWCGGVCVMCVCVRGVGVCVMCMWVRGVGVCVMCVHVCDVYVCVMVCACVVCVMCVCSWYLELVYFPRGESLKQLISQTRGKCHCYKTIPEF